jgi:diguanylate cyclase (GGDEF)-like protein
LVEFLLLAVLTAPQWVRQRQGGAGWLTLTFAILGGLVLVARIDPDLVGHEFVAKSLLALLLVTPYCLFRFAASFRPPTLSVRVLAALVTAGIVAFTVALPSLPFAASLTPPPSLGYRVALAVAFGFLCSYIVIRLLLAARGEPVLAAWRLRLLALAVAGLELQVAVVALDLQGEKIALGSAALTALTGGLFLVALVWSSFVRVFLGRRDELAFRQAVAGLLSARDSRDVAERLLPFTCALVGASQASLTTADGTVIARSASWAAQGTGRKGGGGRDDTDLERRLSVHSRAEGPYTLSVWISPYMLYFGTEELHQLDQLAAMIGLGIERCAMAEQVAFAASHDALTGLANRSLFVERLEEAVRHVGRRRSSLCVMFIDLDRFKLVNDRADHSAGDLVLKEMANRLTTMTRGVDMVARFGGDEFVLFAEVDHEQDAVDMAERIGAGLRVPVALGDAHLSVSASIGLVVTGDDSSTAATLLREADNAMYEAKRAGRDQISLSRSNAQRTANAKWGLSPTRGPDVSVSAG